MVTMDNILEVDLEASVIKRINELILKMVSGEATEQDRIELQEFAERRSHLLLPTPSIRSGEWHRRFG
jgi:hypothetical protein